MRISLVTIHGRRKMENPPTITDVLAGLGAVNRAYARNLITNTYRRLRRYGVPALFARWAVYDMVSVGLMDRRP